MHRNRVRELRLVRAGDLKPDPRNWRRHPRSQEMALTAMLERVGYADAVIARETPDGLVLVDGHLRAGLDPEQEVPVLIVDLDEAEAGEVLATLDPLAMLASTDLGILEAIIQDADLPDQVTDVLPTLPRPFHEPEMPSASDDAPKTRVGDLIVLGRNRLLCGDATDLRTIAKVTAEAAANEPRLCVTDPPYNVAYDRGWRRSANKKPYFDLKGRFHYGKGRREPLITKITGDEEPDFQLINQVFKSLSDSQKVFYVWTASLTIEAPLAALAEIGAEIRSMLVWAKSQPVFSRGHYNWQHEMCIYAVKTGKTARWQGGSSESTVWEIPMPSRNIHPTMKPIECMQRPIRNHEGDVFDPFVGSGTTILAAEREGRACYAIELEPKWCDLAVRRWEEMTGEKAQRQA